MHPNEDIHNYRHLSKSLGIYPTIIYIVHMTLKQKAMIHLLYTDIIPYVKIHIVLLFYAQRGYYNSVK